ncbi:MAG: hypothetical protein AAF571_04195 [Verrucomicrobiota bacterium]
MNAQVDPKDEAQAILRINDGDMMQSLAVVQKQLDVIYSRAQILMSLAGVVVTVTGFSGRLIAGSSQAAQIFLVSGLFVSLGSVIWVFWRVMRVRWVTILLAADPEHALENALVRRNNKNSAYCTGGKILCIGLILYSVSIALMLMNPEIVSGPVR